MLFLRRTLPMILAFVTGIIGISIYYVPHSSAQGLEEVLARWLRIVYAFAFFLGLFSLLNLHWRRVRARQAGWGYSLIVYLSFGLMIFFVLYNDGTGPFSPQARAGGYQWLFLNVQVPCGATMFSILAFFISSAAYRTFRARTPEAAILLVAAVIVMLGRVPVGAYIHDFFPAAAQWLMDVPNMAAKRGILLGVSLGIVATSLRIIFGIERSYLGGGEE
ncbi:MAG: hypothetical protein HOC74_31270 [Gemmatimonadetes bacterium]|jgi:hypothetical protein|nr:hypothetical protein [Gemmatimonadota bacterium]